MIKIQLENAEAAYRPGDTISGSVEWSEEEGDALEARLIWFTRGKGDRDFEMVAVQHVANYGQSGNERFQFTAPHRPRSFSGKLVSLQWAIEAIVFPGQNNTLKNLTISNSGKEIDFLPKQPLDSKKKPLD